MSDQNGGQAVKIHTDKGVRANSLRSCFRQQGSAVVRLKSKEADRLIKYNSRGLLLLLLIILFFPVSRANACECAAPEGSIEEQIMEDRQSADVIFSGTVKDIQSVPPKKGKTIDYQRTEFSMDEVFKGQVFDRIYVVYTTMATSCGYAFHVDETYLVYAYEHKDGKYHTGLCTGTDFLQRKRKEELEILRKINGSFSR